MLDKELYSFKELTNHGQNFWRIDWVGYLKYSRNGRRSTEPLVEVFLSKTLEHPNTTNFKMKFATDYKNQRKILIPVEILTLLRIGDVWQNGQFVFMPEYQTVTFPQLEIDHLLSNTIIVGSRNKAGEFLTSSNIHPYHIKAARVYCEQIDFNTGHYLIIPHYVILQTYFSKSS